MRLKSLLATSAVVASMAFTGCQDKDFATQAPTESDGPHAGLRIGMVRTLPISRASGAEKPFQETGDPNENYIHKVRIVVYDKPLNSTSGDGVVLDTITYHFTNQQNQNAEHVIEKKDANDPDKVTADYWKWTWIAAQEGQLKWYDNNGTAQDVFKNDLSGFRAWITYQVEERESTRLAERVDALSKLPGKSSNSWMYAIALVNMDFDQFTDAAGNAKTIGPGMSVSTLRDLIYVGDLYRSVYAKYPYDPDDTSTKFPWGPTGYAGGDVRFTDFAMSAVNEVKFQPKFVDNTFTFPDMMVQRLAARIDIAFGVQAADRYRDDEVNGNTDRTRHPYITDRGWFYVGEPDANGNYPNADTNASDHKTGPGNNTNAPLEDRFGAGFVGLVDVTPNPGEGYIAKYLYDVDITGDDYRTGDPFGVIEVGQAGGVTRPWKWGSELKYNGTSLTVLYGTYHGTTYPTGATIDGYDSMTNQQKKDFDEFLKDNLQYSYIIHEDGMTNFMTKNYAGQYRFPIYDEYKFQAGEGDVLITGAVFYLQSIRLLNCNNRGVYLFEQTNDATHRYMSNEGDWIVQQQVEEGEVTFSGSYPTNFIYSPASRSISHRQLTGLENFDHRPVPCIQSGLKIPNSSRTLQAPKGDKHWGVYSILGYVGENTYETYNPSNKYTGIQLDGVTNLGHYFTDTEQLETNDGNLRTRVTVNMNMCHSFGGGGNNALGQPMHFGIVRNTVYRVYVKFYAAGETMYVRYYYYNGRDQDFHEIPYTKADFYSNILEDDRYRPVVD